MKCLLHCSPETLIKLTIPEKRYTLIINGEVDGKGGLLLAAENIQNFLKLEAVDIMANDETKEETAT